MTTLTLQIPDDLVTTPGVSPEAIVDELRLVAAIHWYHQGEISQERAAQIAGMDRTDFLDALARARVDAFHVDPDELREELQRGLDSHRERVAAHPADSCRPAGNAP